MKASRVFWAFTLLTSGCMPLVFPINYRSIHGTVGYQMSTPVALPCDSPQIDSPAIVEQGGLPPGLGLQPDGKIGGIPTAPGRWHAMVRSPRYQCESRIYPDHNMAVHFDILELSTALSP